jgi:Tfp pilus assembly protein PilV
MNSGRKNLKRRSGGFAFTILEVMIALAIFFACVFGILALVSQSLRQARSLRAVSMDARSAISLLSQTNRLEEGPIPLEIKLAFEQENPGYIIEGQIVQVETNGLFQVEFYVGGQTSGESKGAMAVTNTVLFYRPMSQQQTGVRIRR